MIDKYSLQCKSKMISWHLLFSSSSIKTFSTLRSDRVHVLPVWLIGDMHTYTHTQTHTCTCVCHGLNTSMCVCVCLWVCLYVCVFAPLTAHPSCLSVDLARTAEFISDVEVGRRSDTDVGGLLYSDHHLAVAK